MSSKAASIREASRLIPTDQQADFLGVLCSAGCAVHCAATPVLVSVLPSVSSLKLLTAPLFHQAVALVCAVIVARAIFPKWSQHRSHSVLLLAVGGLGLVFLDAFWASPNCCEFHTDASLAYNSRATNPAAWLGQSGSVIIEPAAAGVAIDPRHPLSLAENGLFSANPRIPWLLAKLQIFLSPLGGLLLILAHILNIRLNCCLGSTVCRPSADSV